MRYPTNTPVTVPFGVPTYAEPAGHSGTDYSYYKWWIPRPSLYAVEDMVITAVGYDEVGGKFIWARSIRDPSVEYYYGHVSQPLTLISAHHKENDKVAIMGDTGLARGRHLHFMVRKSGKLIDPHKYVTRVMEYPSRQDVIEHYKYLLDIKPKEETIQWYIKRKKVVLQRNTKRACFRRYLGRDMTSKEEKFYVTKDMRVLMSIIMDKLL